MTELTGMGLIRRDRDLKLPYTPWRIRMLKGKQAKAKKVT